jgi:hypothetical protein
MPTGTHQRGCTIRLIEADSSCLNRTSHDGANNLRPSWVPAVSRSDQGCVYGFLPRLPAVFDNRLGTS